MRTLIHIFTAVLFLLLFFTLSLFAQQPQKLKKAMSDYLTEYYINKNITSISAGLAVDGEIFWQNSKGYADMENYVQSTVRTVYRVASVSKAITAVALMQLVEQGKVKLDDDVRKYLTYFPKKRWTFTVRQVLNHTSGLRNYREGEFDSKKNYKTTRDIIEEFMQDSLQYKPGTKFLYSTLSYNLIAGIIEKVSGLTFAEYLRQNVFQPAGMLSSTIDYQQKIVANRARYYQKDEYRQLENAPLVDLSNKFAGGGILSTTEDLLRFGIAILEHKLIKKSTLDTMLVPASLPNKIYAVYGLGFSLGKDNKGRFFFGHDGYMQTSSLVLYPDENMVLTHLINIRDRNLENPLFPITSIMLDDEITIPLKPLSDKLLDICTRSGIDSAIVFASRISADTTILYNKSLSEFLLFGYDLLNIKKVVDAINYFRYLAALHPDSPDVLIGLADSYYKDKNKGMAIRCYRRVLQLDPKNLYAAGMIKKLEG